METLLSSITTEFLDSILPKKVKSFRVLNGSEEGVNYSTELVLVRVAFQDARQKEVDLVIKVPPEHSLRQHFLDKLNLFPKEIFIFQTIIPELQKLAQENSKGEFLMPITAPFVAGRVCKDTNEAGNPLATFFATEDIRPRGFERVDDYTGLDLDHCRLLISETARLHALSLLMKKRKGVNLLEDCYPLLIDYFFKEVHSKDNQTVLSSNYNLARDLVKKTLGENSEEYKAINGVTRNLADLMAKYNNSKGLNEKELEAILVRPPTNDKDFLEESWTVLCHGDLKTNNVLFRYDPKTSKPIEVALFDFQFYRECCLTVDLAFLLYSSTDHEFRNKHLDEMLAVYHDSFVDCCRVLQIEPFPGFSLNTLKRKFHRSKPFGLMAALIVLPMVIQSHGESSLKKQVDDGGDWSEFLTLSNRAESDLKVLGHRFCGLTTELHLQGVI